ncbi:hypothetical protein PIB30_081422 [Stylosanthes scabra]|uniref:Uncharacterized protein n=1 Tax=Stylosanthes scabra TaxID=79078 RepID=A0ABU6STT9_9FABA|nr:hypothetical protein [Stylosanthes scabra]
MANHAANAFGRYCGTTDTRLRLRKELKPPESLDHNNLQPASPFPKLEPAPENSEIYGVRIPNPWILSELTRPVIVANPTGPVLVPNHYHTHFPKDDTLIAPNVYVLISIYNMRVSSFLIWYAGTLALVTPHVMHYAGSPLFPSIHESYHPFTKTVCERSLSFIKQFKNKDIPRKSMMITWKSPIMMIEQALGRYVASSGKYALGVIRDIYWIGRVGYYNRPNELISHRDRHTSYAFE